MVFIYWWNLWSTIPRIYNDNRAHGKYNVVPANVDESKNVIKTELPGLMG